MATESVEPASSNAPRNLAFAKGLEVAFEAGSRWNGSLVSYLLTGKHQPDETLLRPWKLDDCQLFDRARFPVFVLGPIADEEGLCRVYWANKVAQEQFGRVRTAQETFDFVAQMPPDWAAIMQQGYTYIFEPLKVRRQRVEMNCNIAKFVATHFVSPLENAFNAFRQIRMEAFDVDIDGCLQTCYLLAVTEELNVELLRCMALSGNVPIHTYMFDQHGQLMYATGKATLKLKEKGFDPGRNTLADLLVSNGHPQAALAKEALEIICTEFQPRHSLTLSSVQPDGSLRYTLYEMWPSHDPVDHLEAVMIISTYDVTEQKRAELELQGLKNSLVRHNTELQQRVDEGVVKQAALEAERLMLQARLKHALKPRLVPKTTLDTASPIDRAVLLLDGFLEGRLPAPETVLEVRNCLLDSANLRGATNLEQQLQRQLHISADAGKSLLTLLQDDNTADRHLAAHCLLSGRPRRKISHGLPGSGNFDDYEPLTNRASSCIPALHSPIVRRSVTLHAERLLQDALDESLQFDVIKLDEATEGHSLSCLTIFLLKSTGLMESLGMDSDRMSSALIAIERGYEENPYHNRQHVASVVHFSYTFFRAPGGLRDAGIEEDLLELSFYLAAACHDFEHPGLTNDYLTKSHHKWAMQYNDRSPLENHHASGALILLHDHLFADNPKLEEELGHAMRATIIELILATDMKQHFTLLSRLQGAFQLGGFCMKFGSNMAGSLEQQVPGRPPSLTAGQSISPANQLLALQIALKCADVGHVALPWKLHREWVTRLQTEYFSQGDRERLEGMPVSALMDRRKASELSSSQVGFFEVVVLPMFQSLVAVIPGAQTALDIVTDNYYMWRKGTVKTA